MEPKNDSRLKTIRTQIYNSLIQSNGNSFEAKHQASLLWRTCMK